MTRAVRWVMLFVFALVPPAAHAESCIWYSGEDSLHQLRTDSHEITAVVAQERAGRLVMNAADCGVWALDRHERTLLRYGPDGALERVLRLRAMAGLLSNAEQLEIDPYDGSLWLADDRRIVHVSPSGVVLRSFTAPEPIERMVVALDQSLWVLGKRRLWHYDARGAVSGAYLLGEHVAGGVRHVALDGLGGLLWIAGKRELVQLDLSHPGSQRLHIRLPEEISGLTLDPRTGTLWIAQEGRLFAYSRAGASIHAVELEALRRGEPRALAFDPVSGSLWVGAEHSLLRFSDAGQLVARITARGADEAIAVPAFKPTPTLALERPPQDALTHNPQPPFTLAYGMQCNGTPCAQARELLAAYRLSATLNGEAIGTQFVFDPDTARASFTPANRLPEGQNNFSARVQDGFGHGSETVAITFTVDTVAPKFLSLAPPDGAVLQSPNVLIQGTIDDPLAAVTLAGSGLVQTGAGFAFAVALQPGLNSFSLAGTDRAGNVALAALRLTLAAVSVSIASPASGATISGNTVTVSGSLQGPANTGVTVNGVPAIVSGASFVATGVPLQAGINTLSVTASAPDGQSATRTVQVTGTGPAQIQVSASPAQGVAPLTVGFAISNRSGNAIASLDMDFLGTGTYHNVGTAPPGSLTYAAGTYPVGFIITDSSGARYEQTLTIVAQDPAQIDQTLRAAWSGFTAALAARDTGQALRYFNAQGQARYGPVLDALQPDLPRIVASFTPALPLTIGAEIGEYVVGRTSNGARQIFLINFLRDADGVWRLDSM